MSAPPLARARRRALGTATFAVAALVYLIAEAITAAAWRDPVYNYTFNYISDLGVPTASHLQGRVVNSPLSAVMNTGFIVHGVLFFLAVLLLRSVLTGTVARRTVIALAAIHAVGISLVGQFHGSQDAVADGTILFHGVGALLAIIAGNAAVIVTGTTFVRNRVDAVGAAPGHRVFGTVLIGLGILGIAAFMTLKVINGSDYDGAVERVAVYTIIAAELLTAAAWLFTRRSAAKTATTR